MKRIILSGFVIILGVFLTGLIIYAGSDPGKVPLRLDRVYGPIDTLVTGVEGRKDAPSVSDPYEDREAPPTPKTDPKPTVEPRDEVKKPVETAIDAKKVQEKPTWNIVTDAQLTYLDHQYFQVAYDEKAKNPAWVVYHMDGPIVYQDQQVRPPKFATDRGTKAKVTHDDYTRSGFDRGHLCPSYAMFAHYGPAAMEATFVMSNVIPQYHGVNAGVWEDLEALIAGRIRGPDRNRGWCELKGVIVINGPIYHDDRRLQSGVRVPSAMFSLVLDEVEGQGTFRSQSFIVPNQPKVPGSPFDYLVTLRDIEGAADLRFEIPGVNPIVKPAPWPEIQ